MIGQFGSVGSGSGSVVQNGGTFTVEGTLVVAQMGAAASFEQRSGSSFVNGFLGIGEDLGAQGTVTISGGALTAGNTILGGGFVGRGGRRHHQPDGWDLHHGLLNAGAVASPRAASGSTT